MNGHLTKAAAIALIVLAAACGKPEPDDPFAKATIERDLKERPLKQLYEEVEKTKTQWAPPLHGTISESQVASYVKVSKLTQRIVEVTSGEFDDKVEKASRDDDRYSRMATAFSAIGSARNAATAELRAATTLHVNPHEYEWVSRQIDFAADKAMRRRTMERKIAEAEKARNAEENPYLRERRQEELSALKQELGRWQQGLGDAERDNAETVLKHFEELKPYVRRLRSTSEPW